MGSMKDTGKLPSTDVHGNMARTTLETKIVQAGYEPDPSSLAVVPPISVSSSMFPHRLFTVSRYKTSISTRQPGESALSLDACIRRANEGPWVD
jgi:hypothetical protein